MNFAIRIVNLYNFLNELKQERIMSKQILRSGTSVGANIREGQFAESPADFIHKYSVAQKECSETLYWLELLNKTNYITTEQYVSLDTDCTELMKMITSSIITRKKNLRKRRLTHSRRAPQNERGDTSRINHLTKHSPRSHQVLLPDIFV